MKFKGAETPEVYIIDFHEEESTQEYPLSGDRGNYLMSLLGAYSLLDTTRMANITCQGKDVVENDIIEKQPKIIVGLGANAVTQYTQTNRKISDVSGSIYDIKIKGQDFKYLVLVSPSYVLHRMDNSNVSLEFAQNLYKAFQVINGEYKDILAEKTILSAHSFEEFKNIYETYLLDGTAELAYDIETNARPPMMEGSKIIGFSISNQTVGVYTSIDSLDFHMDKCEEDKIWDYLINEVFERKDKLIIHNTMYERPYTLHCKGYEIKYEKAHDTLVMARLLKHPNETAGLKYQAQKYLHYPDWETDLISYITGLTKMIDRVGLGPKKFELFYHKIKEMRSILRAQTTEEFLKLDPKDQQEIQDYSNWIFSALFDLYSKEEVVELDKMITEKMIEIVDQGGVKDSILPYNYVPDRMLSKYGAVDALATYDLKEYYFNIMNEQSTDKIDLHKGYENWLEHIYVAYIMERNGMYWDDEFAEKDRQILSDIALKSMKDLLLSPCFVPHIEMCCTEEFKPIILSDYLPQIASAQGFEVIYDKELGKYTVKKDGKRVARARISEITILSQYRETYISIMTEMFKEKVANATSYEELKDIYNPSSPSTANDVARAILFTPLLQLGGYVTELHTLSENPKFIEVIDKLPAIDRKFLSIASYCCDVDKLKEEYGDSWAQSRKQFFEGFCSLLTAFKDKVTTPEIKNILNNPKPVEIDTFDDAGIIKIYNNMVVAGIDIDDESTWTEELKWLINFRVFKKASKLISSYLDGVTGRSSVAIVDKESVKRGDHDVTRKCNYFDRRATSDEDFLLMAKWGANTAETGRWRSAQHTVPWNSQIKKYYSSRFRGGTTCCPDYSQMEVRTLGAVAHDEGMLELFRSGKDFHTETAKKIFRKDEVTPAERRYSKTATFSLLYGSTAKSFADKYCDGDIDYANMIFEGFYKAYPKVKDWIEEMHREVQRDHRVSLELSNRFIPINPDGEGQGAINSMLRRAQNYPIQGQSADLTGCVIFDLQKYIEENNLKSLIFMYVHDSIEVDIYPYELLQFINYLKYLLNEAPMRRMGLPSEADVALGRSLGHEIELTDIEMNEDMTEGWLSLKGYKDEIDETVETWKEAYAVVEVSDEDYKENFVSMGELFILRKAYTPTLGTMRYKGKCKVHIKYYND